MNQVICADINSCFLNYVMITYYNLLIFYIYSALVNHNANKVQYNLLMVMLFNCVNVKQQKGVCDGKTST